MDVKTLILRASILTILFNNLLACGGALEQYVGAIFPEGQACQYPKRIAGLAAKRALAEFGGQGAVTKDDFAYQQLVSYHAQELLKSYGLVDSYLDTVEKKIAELDSYLEHAPVPYWEYLYWFISWTGLFDMMEDEVSEIAFRQLFSILSGRVDPEVLTYKLCEAAAMGRIAPEIYQSWVSDHAGKFKAFHRKISRTLAMDDSSGSATTFTETLSATNKEGRLQINTTVATTGSFGFSHAGPSLLYRSHALAVSVLVDTVISTCILPFDDKLADPACDDILSYEMATVLTDVTTNIRNTLVDSEQGRERSYATLSNLQKVLRTKTTADLRKLIGGLLYIDTPPESMPTKYDTPYFNAICGMGGTNNSYCSLTVSKKQMNRLVDHALLGGHDGLLRKELARARRGVAYHTAWHECHNGTLPIDLTSCPGIQKKTCPK